MKKIFHGKGTIEQRLTWTDRNSRPYWRKLKILNLFSLTWYANGMWFRVCNKYGLSVVYDIRKSLFSERLKMVHGFYIGNTFIQILK